MKKFTKYILIILCLFLVSGCDVYLYNFDENSTSNSDNSNTENSSNLSGSSTGTTIVNPETNYSGFINYTNQEPTTESAWDVIYERVKSSVVTIRNVVNGSIQSTGSGVFFAEDSITSGYAYIFTNAHVVEGSTSIEVLLFNDIMVEGTLIAYDKNEDVAIIKIAKRDDYSIATLRQSDSLKIGEKVLAIGSPLGEKYSQTATSGIISNLNIAMSSENSSLDLYLIQVDAALNPGNSGGPLFDNAGNLIGINTMKLINSGTSTNIESFNYAIPISHFSLVASYLLQGSLYYRPFLNIAIIDIRLLSSNDRNNHSLEIDHGLLILEIGDTSPLKNKVTVGQVITHIEDIKISKASDFSVELLKYAPNDTIDITICNADGSNSSIIEITLIKR